MSGKDLAEKPEIEIIAEIHNGAAHVVFKSITGMQTALASKVHDKSRWVKVADVQEHATILKTRQHDCRVLFKSPDGQWHDFKNLKAFRSSKMNYICTGVFRAKFIQPEQIPVPAVA